MEQYTERKLKARRSDAVKEKQATQTQCLQEDFDNEEDTMIQSNIKRYKERWRST